MEIKNCEGVEKDTIMNNRDRAKQLEDAIRKHRDEFPDEPLSGELELWNVLDSECEEEKGNKKMNEDEKFKEGDKVVFNLGDNIKRKGTVRGIANTGMPVIGLTWIVELEEKLPTYPFSCIAVFEAWID